MNSTLSPASTKSRTRCSWSAEERAEWLRLLEESGQTVSEFCRQNDLPESTVSLWRRQLREASVEPKPEGEFLEVSIGDLQARAAGASAAPIVVVRLPNGSQLEVAEGTDSGWLAELVRALTG